MWSASWGCEFLPIKLSQSRVANIRFCTIASFITLAVVSRLQFAERNVLQCNNDVRLIDFDLVEGHECDCDAKFDFDLGSPPDVDRVGCTLLWEIGWEMGIWEDMEECENASSNSSELGISGGLGSSSGSESDLGSDLGPRLARDLSLDDGRQG